MISIENIINLNSRNKILILKCSLKELAQKIFEIQSIDINVINIGNEVARFINDKSDLKYINIELQDFVSRLIIENKSEISSNVYAVAIYNLGILLEPTLEINTTILLKEISKSVTLLIIWDSVMEIPGLLHWSSLKEKYYLDFSNIM